MIACGGPGNIEHVPKGLNSGADAVAIASLLHYKMENVGSLKAGFLGICSGMQLLLGEWKLPHAVWRYAP